MKILKNTLSHNIKESEKTFLDPSVNTYLHQKLIQSIDTQRPSKFCGNPFHTYCIILPTIKWTLVKT